MFYGELKAKLDGYIGIVSKAKDVGDRIELVYESPTGVELFSVLIFDAGTADDPHFKFGGNSGALPESWKALCRMHLGQ